MALVGNATTTTPVADLKAPATTTTTTTVDVDVDAAAEQPIAANTASLQAKLDALFADAVKDGVAPGFQYCVFDGEKYLAHGATGNASLPAEDKPAVPMTEDTTCWMASCSKLGIALMVLMVLERGLAKDGSRIGDLDSPEAVLRLLPEFSPDHPQAFTASKIITGWSDEVDPTTGSLTPRLVPRKTVPTLRAMLGNTAGLSYYWGALVSTWWNPGEGRGKPLATLPFLTGRVSDFDVPSVRESDEVWEYSASWDFLGLWLRRATGKNLRVLYRELLFEPLGCAEQCDIWFSDEARADPKRHSQFHAAAGPNGEWVPIPVSVWSCEGDPEETHNHFASAAVHAPHKAYAKVFQACIRRDEALLSRSTWDLAMTPISVPMPPGIPPSSRPDLLQFEGEFSPGGHETATLLSTLKCSRAAVSGKPVGTQSWCGLANSFYTLDPERNVGTYWGTQTLPCGTPEVCEFRQRFEKLVYDELKLHERTVKSA